MLEEVTQVRQNEGELRRRWFSDQVMDLFLWLNGDDAIVGFQLSYDKPHAEKALSWNLRRGFQHASVDDGTRPGQHPGSPILVADEELEVERVMQAFRAHAAGLSPEVALFIVSRVNDHYLRQSRLVQPTDQQGC